MAEPLEPPAGAPPPPQPKPPAPTAQDAPLAELPAGWRELGDLAFERALDAWIPVGGARRLAPSDLSALATALDEGGAVSVRAAVLLARTRDPHAGDVLLAQLEERAPPSSAKPASDAALVVAAAAFAEGTPGSNAAARLGGLATGRRPHPDPFVRVECARSALRLGRDEVVPYLLQVLRTGTTAGRTLSKEDRPEDVAWMQIRAADALSRRAGTERRFEPEASVRAREEEAARLEALLRGPGEKKR